MTEPPIDLASLPRRIHDYIDRWADEAPDATAVAELDGRTLTYAQLREASRALAQALADYGVRGGDRVLIVNENSIAAVTALFAASRLDAWAVPVNARLTATEIDRIREHARPRAIAVTGSVSAEARTHADRYGATEIEISCIGPLDLVGNLPADPEPIAQDGAEQIAVLIYTSGTTGDPKAVMLTHRNLSAVAAISVALRGTNPKDRVIAVIPISHVFGLASVFLGAISAGATVQLFARLEPERLADALEAGASVLQAVPALFARFIDYLERSGRDLHAPRLRYLSAGGAPLDIDWKRDIERRFGTQLHNGYGLTETSSTAGITRIGDNRDDDTIGLPAPSVAIRFVSSKGVECAPGEVGECQVNGPNVMKGYYRNREASRAAFTSDGWLHTGDLGYRLTDGHMFIVGRSKELIIRSGFNVYPIEVETALNSHPDVVYAAVIGRRASGDEEIIACIELKPGSVTTISDLQAHAGARLAPYKRPQHIFILDKLPASPTGKILKAKLGPLAETLLKPSV
ncbi:MAG: class I adenylate-forming enzyme family protein [Hyphomicrobiales bacterium]